MRDTTAMIDVTATTLPSTVISDRSFEAQIAASAMAADSSSAFTGLPAGGILLRRFDPDLVAVCERTHGVVWTGNHFVANFQSVGDLEVLVAGNPELDGNK